MSQIDTSFNKTTNIFNKLLDKFSLGLNQVGDGKLTFIDVIMYSTLIFGVLKLFKVKIKVG